MKKIYEAIRYASRDLLNESLYRLSKREEAILLKAFEKEQEQAALNVPYRYEAEIDELERKGMIYKEESFKGSDIPISLTNLGKSQATAVLRMRQYSKNKRR